MAVVFSNNATTALASSVTSSATSITVQDGSVFPTLSGSDYTYITLEDLAGNVEIVKLTARSVNVLTIVRAQDGTSARAFGIGSKCELRLTAALLNEVAAQADTDTNTTYTAGSGLALTGTVFSNTSPDRTVALTGAGATSISGTYPNFTITSTDTNTVYTHPSSHPISFITGLQAALDGKVDDSQVLTNVPAGALFTDTVYTLPFADNSANWNTAYTYSQAGHLPLAGGTLTGDINLNTNDLGNVRSLQLANLELSDLMLPLQIIADANDGSPPASLGTYDGTHPDGLYMRSYTGGVNYTLYHTGHFSGTHISNWNTAYGWGNHASQSYATQSYVGTAISNLVDSSPATLDTLNELAAALGDDPNFATTVTNSIATKLPLAGGTLTGQLVIDDGNANPLELKRNAQVGIEFNDTSVGSRYLGVNGGNLWFGGNLNHGVNSRVFHDTYHPNADTLTTARTINGVSFNGSANITVADATKLPLAGGTLTGGLSGTTGSFSGAVAAGTAASMYTSTDRGYFVAGTNDASNQHLYLGSYHGTTLKELTFSGSNNAFYPQTSASIDLGLTSKKFKNLELSGTISSGDITSSGNVNVGASSMTSGNPSLYLYGYDAAAAAAKSGRLSVGTDGSFNITAQDTYLILSAASYVQVQKNLNLIGSVLVQGTVIIDVNRNLTNIGTLNGGTPWTSANDGSGSGLDADLLDGQHGSYYATAASVSAIAALDPVITLTGAVTGSGTMTNLGNVSIATTATADPTLTLTGDVTGAATFTNLGNATLTATVADDSHDHTALPRFIEGAGATGAWTGTHPDIEAYTDGMVVWYKINFNGAATTTLDINGLGAKTIYRNGTSKLTTHWPVNSVIPLVYSATLNGGCFLGGYGYDTSQTYDLRWSSSVVNGTSTIHGYQLLMEGADTKFYPVTVGGVANSTTNTVQTAPLRMGGQMLYYSTTTDVAPNAVIADNVLYESVESAEGEYWMNRSNSSSWTTAGLPIYIVGTVNANNELILDNSTTTAFLTNALPTAEDGKVYVHVGYSDNEDDVWRLSVTHPIFEFKAGAIRRYTPALIPSEVLDAVKTVDGASSGLDADLLDGQHGSYYATAASVAAVAALDPVITLTGAVTGTGTMTNLGSVSIATTATSDPVLTLTGDVTGTATFTNLGNATLTAVVADDSHNHIISNVDGLQTALDSKLNLTGGTVSGTLTLDNGGSSVTSLVMKGTTPTISFLDDDTNADDFYIHINSNKFYILANRTDAEVDLVGTGWENPHPMYLDSAANTGYLFDQRMFADNYHPNADTWTTARTLGVTLTGDVTGSATMSVNGGSNQTATITTVVANDSHSHSNYLPIAGKAADSELLDGIDSSGFVRQLAESSTGANYNDPSSRRVNPDTGNPTNEHYAVSTFGNGSNVTGQLATHFVTGEAYTRGYNTAWAPWRKQWDSLNDGSGSGLDADLLDGQQGSYYYPASNPSGYNNYTHPAYTARSLNTTGAQVLDILTTDAIGSVTNATTRTMTLADLGYTGATNANYITNNNQLTNGAGYITSSGSAGSVSGITSDRIVYGGSARKSTQVSAFAGVNEVSGFYFGNNASGAPTTDWINYLHIAGNNWVNNYSFQLTHAFHSDSLWISRTTNGLQYAARKIWDSASDGAGSGLDADLLDGQEGSYYAPASHNHSGVYLPIGGKAADSELLDGIDSSSFLRSNADDFAAGKITFSTGIARNNHNVGHLEGSYNSVGANSTYSNPIYTIGSSYNPPLSATTGMYGIGYSHPNFPSWGSGKSDGWGLYVAEAGGIHATISVGGMWSNGAITSTAQGTLWGSSNDGSGSGLDADLLDGVQGASYLRSDATGTATGVMTFSNTVNLQGSVVFSNPIENFNTFTANKIHHSIETNMLAGKGSKLKVTIDGVESTAAASGLTNQNFEDWSVISATAGSAPKVINIDLVTNGLYGASGITYAAGFVVLNFYSSPFPSGWSARVKNKDGVWTAMTMTKIGTTLRGTIPIGNYITDLEFTLESGTTGPYVTGTVVWGLCEVAYYGSRMALSQGASVTSIGGYIDGNLTFGKTSGAPFIVNSTSVVTNLNADLLDGQQGSYYYPASNPNGYTANTGTMVETGTTFSGTYPLSFRIGANSYYSHGDITYTGSTGTLNSTTGNYTTTSGAHTFTTAHGNIQLGPMNGTWAHIYTNIGNGFYFNKEMRVNGNLVWHAGNDGSGSGLDADLLDGSHKVDIQKELVNVTSPAVTVADSCLPSTGYGFKHFLGLGPSNNDGHILGMTWTNTSSYGAQIFVDTDPTNTMAFRSRNSTGVWTSWNTVWHTGNDGSGSGLDADLLDGQQGSYYAPASHSHSYLPLSGGTLTGSLVAPNLILSSGTGNKIGFWGGTASYSIHMSTSAIDGRVSGETTSDYNMYFTMAAGTNRGFNFRNGATNVAGIDAAGNGRFTGTVTAPTFNATSTVSGGFQGIDADTITTPSFTWTSDLDTGMWHAGADAIGFTTGGVNRITINSAGISGAGAGLTGLNGSNITTGTVAAARVATLNQNTTGSSGSCTGNSATATALQTARTINGVSFNGTANITVADGTKLPLAGGTATGTINAPTFNATSTTSGGFQGIDADTITAPSFTWTSDLNTGMWHAAADAIGFTTGGVNRLTIDSTGITAVGNVTAYSDARLKENIKVIPDALSKVQQLRGVTFTRNDMEDLEQRHTGVIAQEVEAVLPEAVSEDTAGIKNVAYGNMVGLLIEAIKELKSEVDDLKQQLENK